ncbi:MAG: hypothetical protein ATN36_08565 [Epulopiscium sp. Nele67-Bin005]|nr:MAG: hypothetical protein ATN36_08565 [Epulopiscium sp. Nele67-Bin005]
MGFIDLHCDTACRIFEQNKNLYENDLHIDIKKLQQGNYYAQWFAFFVKLETLGEETAFSKFNRMYDYFMKQLEQNKEYISVVSTAEQYKKAKQEGKVAAFLSTEEGEIVAGGLDKVDYIESLGLTLMTLTWNYKNSLACPHQLGGGLTPYGKEVVDYVNHKNMFLDVSHLSDEGIDEILEIYKKPLIASHSNAREVRNVTRNLCDRHIKAIANTGGVIGVNFYSGFLSSNPKSTIKDIKAMVDYLYKVGGIDVVAMGTDFDGIDCELEVSNGSQMGRLIQELEKSYSADEIEKITYKNTERLILENLK